MTVFSRRRQDPECRYVGWQFLLLHDEVDDFRFRNLKWDEPGLFHGTCRYLFSTTVSLRYTTDQVQITPSEDVTSTPPPPSPPYVEFLSTAEVVLLSPYPLTDATSIYF